MGFITNEDIIKFYSSRVENKDIFQRTYSFEEKYRQSDGGYINLAKVFDKKGDVEECDNKLFFDWLLKKKKEGTIYELKSFWYVKKDKEFDIFLNDSGVNQKWHCLVSWYAYKEFLGELNDDTYRASIIHKGYKTCILNTKNSCPELRLWLVEAAVDGKNITNDDVKQFKEKAEIYAKSKREKLTFWNEQWKVYRKKIEEVILAAGKNSNHL